jgi:hypothetical protein
VTLSQAPPLVDAPLSLVLYAQRAPDAEQAEALAAWQRSLKALGRDHEVLLVRPHGAAYPLGDDIRVFGYEPADGFVSGLRLALEAAQHPLVVLCPCDGQYQPADVARLVAPFAKSEPPPDATVHHRLPDAVIGYRGGRPAPAWRRGFDLLVAAAGRVLLGSPLQARRAWYGHEGWRRRWLARWVFGLRLTDPECAFRVFRREVLAGMPLQSRGYFVQVEMLAKANHLECVLAEEPVAWTRPTEPELDEHYGADMKTVFRSPEFKKTTTDSTNSHG